MTKGIIILGNGFDLDLGLKTNYADFAKSRFWDELMSGNPHSLVGDRLLGFLRAKYNVEKWIDIEAALLEYALQKTQDRDVKYAAEDRKDFGLLCGALKAYLMDQQKSFVPKSNSVAKELLRRFSRLSSASALYSFNYTMLNVLSIKIGAGLGLGVGNGLRNDAIHIHGSLQDDGNLILGIDTTMEIIEDYAFLFKTQNRQYRHTDILKDLRGREEYLFFGHSLNGMDYSYFSLLFSNLTISHNPTPRLTIITKNEEEEERFKNFLRRSHVSLQELYSNSIPTFILTDEVYKRSEDELDKLNALLVRIQNM